MDDTQDPELPLEMQQYVADLKRRLAESAAPILFMGFHPRGIFYPLVQRHMAQFGGLHQLANLAIDRSVWQRYNIALKLFEDLGESIAYFVHPCRSFDPLDVQLGPMSSVLELRVSSLSTVFADQCPDWIERACRIGDPRRHETLRLYSKALGGYLGASFEEASRSIASDAPLERLMRTMAVAAGDLLILAHAATETYRDQGPLWEFLRHCRNAAAHGGRFNFNQAEPRRLAEWRGFRIERSMQGNPLIDTPGLRGFLDKGDPIVLLHDLETAFPKMIG
jgi:hypothetical protein